MTHPMNYAYWGGNDLTRSDEEGQRVIFRDGDFRARTHLLELSHAEFEAGNWEGSAILFHAEMYLSDRLAYELWTPPTRYAVPTGQWPKQHLDWQEHGEETF